MTPLPRAKPRSGRLRQVAAVLGLQLWVVAFVGFFGSELLASYPGVRVATQVLFVVPLAVWAILRMRGPRDRLDWAILGSLAALLIVSFASADRRGSLETVGLAIAYLLAFAALRELGGRPRLRTAAAVAASYAMIFWLAMAAIWWIGEKVTWVQAFGGIPNLESYQVFIWGTANVFPIMSLLTVGLLLWAPPGLGRRLLAITWFAASVVAVPLSAGRAGWLGFAVAAVAYEGLSGWPRVRAVAARLRRSRLYRPVVAGGILVAVAAVALAILKAGPVIQSNFEARSLIWQQAVGIFAANPLTGGGPGTFSWLRLTHSPDYTYATSVALAHDVVLQTLADGGLVLAAGFLALLVAFVSSALPRLADPRRRATFAVLLGFATASLLDDFSSLPAIIVIVIGLAAWTVSSEEPVPRKQVWMRAVLPVSVLVAGLAVLPSVAGIDIARSSAGVARTAAVNGNWADATSGFKTATEAYPTGAGYWLGLGLSEWEAGDLTAATAAYRKAADLSPGDARPWGALAALSRDPAERIRLLDTAAGLTVTDPQYSFRLGDALRLAGQPDEALHAYGIAVAIAPDVIRAFPPFTASTDPAHPMPQASVVAQEAVKAAAVVKAQASAAVVNGIRWDLALALGNLPTDAGPAWRAVALAEAGDLPAAQSAANEAFAAAPYTDVAQRARSAVAAFACEEQSYDRMAAWFGPYRATRRTLPVDIRDNTYRDNGLGTYQPMETYPLPLPGPWPWVLIGTPPACPSWTPTP